MARDPFADLITRALGRAVERVETERVDGVGEIGGAETERVRWTANGETGSLLFRRYPPRGAIEAAILPILARRHAPVPEVLASGVPPRHAPESRPWLLMRDPGDVPADRADTLAAMHHARAAIGRDLTTLASLGVPSLPPSRVRDEALWSEELLDADEFDRVRELAASLDAGRLDAREPTLVHGALDLAAASREDSEPAVLLGWSRAHLGSPLVDEPHLDAAGPILASLFAIRWYAWEAREMLRARVRAAELVRAELERYN
jgi:hypothetical protein